jgi:type I restriction-modification system DNA methylase subunit
VVLGLVFLKYVSDAFEERQKELREQFQNPDHDYYMAPEDYADDAMEAIERENEKKLKNVLNKDFARTQIDSHKLADLIAHFSDTDFNRKEYNGLKTRSIAPRSCRCA